MIWIIVALVVLVAGYYIYENIKHKPKLKPPIPPEPTPPEPSYKKLDESLRADKQKRFIMPVFIPCMWSLKDLDEDEVNKKQLDRIAGEGLGNAERAFAFCSFKGVDTFLITDPMWMDVIKWRVGERVKRGILPIVTLIDHCSTYGRWWNHPWHNPDGKEAIFDPNHPVFKNKVIPYVRNLVTELEREFSPFIAYEIGNEVPAGLEWHKQIRQVLRECGVKAKWRVLTSLYQHRYFDKKMLNFLDISVHHATDRESYEALKKEWNIKTHFSEDGRYPEKGAWEYKQLMKQILADNNLGFEFNGCHPARFGGKYVPDKWDWDIIRAIGQGFRDSFQ